MIGAGTAALAHSMGCSKKSIESAKDAAVADAAQAPWVPFPIVQVRGSPAELGEALGAATRSRIATCLQRRKAWFEDLKAFALADRAARLDAFTRAAEARHPDVMAEIRGMARGAGRELDDLLVLNFHPELAAMKAQATCGDCSTLHLVRDGAILLAHNEDDDDAYRDQMVILKASPNGKPSFVTLAYPGATPGNVPGMNGAGLVRTTNFIGAKEVKPGVPRYVIGRAVLSASTFEEAIRIATTKDGAYSFHLNLGAVKEKRLLSLEVGPGGVSDRHETTNEVYVHTNHFVLPATRSIAQQAYPSSQSRYEVLQRELGGLSSPDALVRALSSHESITRPYSPCRHPEGSVRGRTVALALFDIVAGKFVLYEGNPCEGRRRDIYP
jgi:predicted choloylglycine hydrolase